MASATEATSTMRKPSIRGSADGCASTQAAATSTDREAPTQIRFTEVIFSHFAPELRPVFQHVASATHGVNQLLLKRVVQLGAQPANVDIDIICIAIEIDVPNLIGDEGSRKNLARAARQQRQQQEFLVREIQTM